jgi:hypothetical protein
MELLVPNAFWRSFLADCTPGYYNNEGHLGDQEFPLGSGYHQGATAYFRYIRDWRASGEFAGLEFSRAAPSVTRHAAASSE